MGRVLLSGIAEYSHIRLLKVPVKKVAANFWIWQPMWRNFLYQTLSQILIFPFMFAVHKNKISVTCKF